jgi:NTE family protein
MRRRTLISAGIAAAATGVALARQAQGAQMARATGQGEGSPQGPQPSDAGQRVAANTRRRIGIALGSGSAHGLAHIGMLRALERIGLRPDVIAGTSAGAIAGVLFAAGLEPAEIEAVVQGMGWRSSGRLTWPVSGLMSNAPLQRRIDQAVGYRRIEALPFRFGAVASNVMDGSRVLLRSGAVGPAVGASSSVPVIFEPVRVDGVDLVDGSLTEPVPVDSARAMGADFVIAVDIAYRPHDEPPVGMADMAFQAMHILINALIAEQVRRADFTLRIELHHLMHGDWAAQTMIDEGERAMRAAWPALRERLQSARFEVPRN